ncbi:MAG: hypothetical protein H0W78_16030 [Planctomycetes bacterium]|nr:hypothetical protein [Planctomycetota bacterium]
MSTPNESNEQDPVTEQVIIESSDNENDRKGIVPAWLISFGAHAAAVAIMTAVVFGTVEKKEEERAPMRPVELPPIVQEKPPEVRTDIDPTPINIQVTEPTPEPQPVTLIEITDIDPSTAEANADGSPGDPLAVTDVQVGDTGAFMAIGTGNKGAGIFGLRTGPGRIRAARQTGNPETAALRTSSIEAALRWFKRHQSPNGMWDVDQYQANCPDVGMKCEPGVNQAGDADIACTAYAIMCFLGAGYDHITPNKHRPVVAKAVEWLLAQQKADGLFGERNYEHAVATMALAEALGMSNDQRLRTPAQKAVDVVIARQAQDPDAKDKAYAGLAWDYVAPNAARNDTSVSGWSMMALKSALGAGLQVGNSMHGAKVWLERAWKAANPDWKKLDPYQGTSVFPYTFDATSDKVDKEHLSCVGALCAIYLGHHKGDVMLETMANSIMKNDFPTTWPTNTYFLYYNTLAVFQMGDERWKQWDAPVAKLLSDAQRTDDTCFNGSWDYAGTKFHGHDTGRLLSTAYACLSQEVIWRYTRVEKK